MKNKEAKLLIQHIEDNTSVNFGLVSYDNETKSIKYYDKNICLVRDSIYIMPFLQFYNGITYGDWCFTKIQNLERELVEQNKKIIKVPMKEFYNSHTVTGELCHWLEFPDTKISTMELFVHHKDTDVAKRYIGRSLKFKDNEFCTTNSYDYQNDLFYKKYEGYYKFFYYLWYEQSFIDLIRKV